jgi:hypothetical protein
MFGYLTSLIYGGSGQTLARPVPESERGSSSSSNSTTPTTTVDEKEIVDEWVLVSRTGEEEQTRHKKDADPSLPTTTTAM